MSVYTARGARNVSLAHHSDVSIHSKSARNLAVAHHSHVSICSKRYPQPRCCSSQSCQYMQQQVPATSLLLITVTSVYTARHAHNLAVAHHSDVSIYSKRCPRPCCCSSQRCQYIQQEVSATSLLLITVMSVYTARVARNLSLAHHSDVSIYSKRFPQPRCCSSQ